MPKTELITSPITYVRFSSFIESLGIDIGIVDIAIGARVIGVPLSIIFQVYDLVLIGADVITRSYSVVTELVTIDSRAPSFEIREA